MKTRCYPKYSYVSITVVSIIMFVCSIGPLIIKTNDDMIVKVSWSLIMLIMSIILMIGSIHHMQYYYIDGNYIVVKSAFGTIMKLDAFNVSISIETLPTYYSWAVGYIEDRWICIYDKSLQHDYSSRFKSGCSNNKKLKRIQIIYNDVNRKEIELWVKKFNLGK